MNLRINSRLNTPIREHHHARIVNNSQQTVANRKKLHHKLKAHLKLPVTRREAPQHYHRGLDLLGTTSLERILARELSARSNSAHITLLARR